MKKTLVCASLVFLSTMAFADAIPSQDQLPPLSNTLSEANNSPSAGNDVTTDSKDDTLEMKNFAWNGSADGTDAEQIEGRDPHNGDVDNEYYE